MNKSKKVMNEINKINKETGVPKLSADYSSFYN
jgi:hypothetical protein